jgi:hypothetical protein
MTVDYKTPRLGNLYFFNGTTGPHSLQGLRLVRISEEGEIERFNSGASSLIPIKINAENLINAGFKEENPGSNYTLREAGLMVWPPHNLLENEKWTVRHNESIFETAEVEFMHEIQNIVSDALGHHLAQNLYQ